jgi:hypothetical protein
MQQQETDRLTTASSQTQSPPDVTVGVTIILAYISYYQSRDCQNFI